jgi:hypothetical protein
LVFIVDGRQLPPRASIYARLTNPRLPNAVIRRLTRRIVVEHGDCSERVEVLGNAALWFDRRCMTETRSSPSTSLTLVCLSIVGEMRE